MNNCNPDPFLRRWDLQGLGGSRKPFAICWVPFCCCPWMGQFCIPWDDKRPFLVAVPQDLCPFNLSGNSSPSSPLSSFNPPSFHSFFFWRISPFVLFCNHYYLVVYQFKWKRSDFLSAFLLGYLSSSPHWTAAQMLCTFNCAVSVHIFNITCLENIYSSQDNRKLE